VKGTQKLYLLRFLNFGMKDYIFAVVAGVVSAFFLLPVFKNLSINISYYGFVFLFLPVSFIFAVFVSSKFKAQWFRQFIKFAIVGFLNTTIDFGILNFISLKFHIYSGVKIIGVNPLSFIVAGTNSFLLNKYFTFNEKTKIEAGEVLRFAFIVVTGMFINTGIVFLATNYVNFNGLSEGQVLNLGKALATGISLFWNFFGMRIFVFKAKTTQTLSEI